MHAVHQTILITGGASGLGAACARHMAAAGAQVVIADLEPQKGAALVTQIGPSAHFVQVDVTDESDVQTAIQVAVDVSEGSGLRALINCAGIAPGERVLGKSGPHALDLFARVIQINLTGTFNAMRLAAAAMAGNEPNGDGERGVIINTASVAAFEGQIGQAAYAASKGGVASMTLPIARELARQGIRVVAIAPGVFETPMVEAFPEKVRDSLLQQAVFPLRLGQAGEFAALAEHIMSNPMLNGCVIRLDGAVRLPPK